TTNVGREHASARNGSRRLQVVPRPAALRQCPALRFRPRFRAHADVHHWRVKHPRCHSIRTHAGQRRVLALRVIPSEVEEWSEWDERRERREPNEAISSSSLVGRSTLRFSYSGKLKLGTTGFSQCHSIAGNLHLIHRGREPRFNLDPVLVAKPIPATHVANKDGAILGKFPNSCVRTSRHAPFTENRGISATGYRRQQHCQRDYP